MHHIQSALYVDYRSQNHFYSANNYPDFIFTDHKCSMYSLHADLHFLVAG